MPSQALIVLFLLGAAIVLMAAERLRPDLAALILVFALTATGIVPRSDALRSFAGPAVVMLIGVFVLTAGLNRSGATEGIARALVRVSGRSKSRLVVATMGAGATLSLFMSNLAATSLLMPAVVHAAQRVRVSSSRVLLPLAYATQLGGMATLFTTANIVSSGVLRDRGYAGFSVHEFFAIGGLAALAGILWMALVGVRLLPKESPAEGMARVARLSRSLSDQYGLKREMSVLHVEAAAACVGKSLRESGLGEAFGVSVLAIVRDRKTILTPPLDEALREGDLLLVSGAGGGGRGGDDSHAAGPRGALAAAGLRLEPRTAWTGELPTEELGLHEVIVGPRSRAAGQSLRDLHFRRKYGLSVVALLREGTPHWSGIGAMPLRFGDALLLHGPASNVPLLQSDPDWVVLRYNPSARRRTRRVPVAATIFALSLGAAVSGFVPISETLLAGGLLMVLAGCLSMDDAYQAIDWRTIVLVAGMLPVGIALKQSGAADAIGAWIVGVAEPGGSRALVTAIFLFAAILAQVIPAGGATVPAIVGPIAIETALRIGANPRTFVLAAALGTSTSFTTPFGHPVNAFVMAPGGYRVRDYIVAGLPLAIVTSVVILWVLPAIAPLAAPVSK